MSQIILVIIGGCFEPYVSTLGDMVSARKSLLKPGSRALDVASVCSRGFLKFSHKIARFRHVKRKRMRFPLFNFFAASVSCAVCLQRALTVIKVFLCLLLPFLLRKQSSLKPTLALRTSKSFTKLGKYKDFTRIGQCVKFFG